MNKKIKFLIYSIFALLIASCIITCKKEDTLTITEIDQPISVSISIDGKTSVETTVR